MNPRVTLTDISPLAWEHPADRAALNALRALPGFDVVLRKVFGAFGERPLRLAFRANAVRVSDKQYAWLHERTLAVCRVLDVAEPPEVYVTQTPLVNAGAVGMDRPFVIVTTSTLEVLDRDEVEAVLAHEVAHIVSGHALYRTLLLLILRLSIVRSPLGGLVAMPLLFAMLEWYRKSELSCDRAAALAVQEPKVVLSALMKLAGGRRGGEGELDLEEFLQQAEEYRKSTDLLDAVYRVLNVLSATHPFAVLRVAELRAFVDSGDYGRILGGDYRRRSDADGRSVTADLAEALRGYRDAADSVLGEVDATLGRWKDSLVDAFFKRG